MKYKLYIGHSKENCFYYHCYTIVYYRNIIFCPQMTINNHIIHFQKSSFKVVVIKLYINSSGDS